MNAIHSVVQNIRAPHARWPSLALLFSLLTIFLLSGCSSKPYQGADVGTSSFMERSKTQQSGALRVTAAVPDAAETRSLTGLDLYQQGIQPVWLKIENTGPIPVRAAIWSIDREYFSPIEVAYMNRKKFSSEGYQAMERWFFDNGLPRSIPPGATRSGLVYTHLNPGTKGFNLDLFSNRQATSFTFFLPMPGFTADYAGIDFAKLYSENEVRELDQASLQVVLEQELSCCATDATGELSGGPLNVVLVGTPLTVRRSLLRGDWLETSDQRKTANAAKHHRYRGRISDATFHLDRSDGDESLMLNLWMAPWKINSEPVWVGQVFYRKEDNAMVAFMRKNSALMDSDLMASFVRDSVSADIDSARKFMIQNFWYNHSLQKLGITAGVGKSTLQEHGTTFDNIGYFTDGKRAVLFLSETPTTLDKTRLIYGLHNRNVVVTNDD